MIKLELTPQELGIIQIFFAETALATIKRCSRIQTPEMLNSASAVAFAGIAAAPHTVDRLVIDAVLLSALQKLEAARATQH